MGSSQGWASHFLWRGMTNLSRLRKRLLEADAATSTRAADEIDIAGSATIAYSSENTSHPVQLLLDGRSGPGARRWISARPDTIEHRIVEFDQPQAISRLVYEVEEAERERTQEVRVEASEDGGRTYRQILVQEFTFSPGEPPTSAKTSALISTGLAVSVSRFLQTRAAPAWRRHRISASLHKTAWIAQLYAPAQIPARPLTANFVAPRCPRDFPRVGRSTSEAPPHHRPARRVACCWGGLGAAPPY